MNFLVSLSGLPGVGKTTLAKKLAALTPAIHLRVDSVETALQRSILSIHPAEDAGYLALAAIAQDNLLLGFDVIADTVNPIGISRQLWTKTASDGAAHLLSVEVICSDKALHRKRVETRISDIKGLVVPNWHEVSKRTFEPWKCDRLIVDTALNSVDECAIMIAKEMDRLRYAPQ